MKDKIVFITGGNAGIGKATAIALAKKGANVIIACRNLQKGEAALADIRKAAKTTLGDLIQCDLASFTSIQQAATTFLSKYNQLDVLINNAGLITKECKLTAEGFEYQFGINHLGHFLLTHLLLNKLQNTPQSRVVNVASIAHLKNTIDFDRLKGISEPYDGMKAYGQSKLANILFTREFAKRYPNIICNCLHPGVVGTSIGNKDMKWYISLIWSVMKPFLITPEKGAKTSIYLASSPEVSTVTGQYFDDKQKRRNPSKEAQDDALAEKLWDVSMEYVKEYL